MENKLPKIVKGRAKRRGRGYGSGKGGHTVGRGQKGQKARRNIGVLFEGLKVKKSLFKRLPLRPGKGKLKAKKKPLIIKLALLNILPEGSKVDIDNLDKYGIIKKNQLGDTRVKILGDGTLEKKLIICLPISKSAATRVKKAGGEVRIQEKASIKKEEKSIKPEGDKLSSEKS